MLTLKCTSSTTQKTTCYPFTLGFDQKTIEKLKSPAEQKLSFKIWLLSFNSLKSSLSFATKLPSSVGIILNVFEPISTELLNTLQKQKNPIALTIPTPINLPGQDQSTLCLDNTLKSQQYFSSYIEKYKQYISALYFPNLHTMNLSTLNSIMAFIFKHKLPIIIHSQYHNYVQDICQKNGIQVIILDKTIENPLKKIFSTENFIKKNLPQKNSNEYQDDIEYILKRLGQVILGISITHENAEQTFLSFLNSLTTYKINLISAIN